MENGIICIGRQYGSGGREIGEKLAGRLGVPCYDKLLVKRAAEDTGLDPELLRQGEETPVGSHLFLTGNPFVDSAGIAGAFYSESQLAFEAEQKVIRELAAQGPCVIIGRCASFLLREQGCLSVFVYADGEDRLARVAARNGIDRRAAQQRLRRIDRMRRQYFDFYADTQWGRPESYDLMLSSSRYGIDGCARLIADSLVRQKGGAHHE